MARFLFRIIGAYLSMHAVPIATPMQPCTLPNPIAL